MALPYALHIFDHGLRGLALADEVTATPERGSLPHCQIWMDLAIQWRSRQP